MSLSRLSIRRPIGTAMMAICFVILGLFFLKKLPVDLFPKIIYPRIIISVNYPGVDPNIMEQEVTKVLEKELATTDGVVKIHSTTSEGSTFIQLFFDFGRNIDLALQDASTKLNLAKRNLPEDIEQPRIAKSDPAQFPIIEFALSSTTLRGTQLRTWAEEELTSMLSVVPGVASIDIIGGRKEEVQAVVDFPRLQSLGLTLTEVINKLKSENIDISGGRITGPKEEFFSRTSGKFIKAADLEKVSFLNHQKKKVQLRDFAQVLDGGAEQRVFAWLNGAEAIKISILKQPDANTVSVIAALRQKIGYMKRTGLMREGTDLKPVYDQSWYIKSSISNVSASAALGALLASLVVFLFLGSLRRTFIICLTIPIAIFMTFVLMGLKGLTLNIFSLAGLALGVGMLVDCSIVMIENIDRHQKLKDHPQKAAEDGGKEVESPLIASIATNIVAVVPFFFISGFASLLFNELLLTISFSVAASLLAALTIVPMLSARLLAMPMKSGLEKTILLRGIRLLLEKMLIYYRHSLEGLIPWRYYIVSALMVSFIASLFILSYLGTELLPQTDDKRVSIDVRLKQGTLLSENIKLIEELSQMVMGYPEVDSILSVSGGRLFGRGLREDNTLGNVDIQLKPGSNTYAFINELSKRVRNLRIPDARIFVVKARIRGLITSFSTHRKDISVKIRGDDLAVLNRLSEQVTEKLAAVKGLVNVDKELPDPRPEYQVAIDRDRAAETGLSVEEIGNTVRTAIEGTVATKLTRGNREVDVRVQFPQSKIQGEDDIARLALFPTNGAPIPLYHVARTLRGLGPASITREDQNRIIEISGDVRGRTIGEVGMDIKKELRDLEIPVGYNILPGGEEEALGEIHRSLWILALLAIFLVYVVMAVQYDSVINPFVIMFTVPMALMGSIVGLYVTKTPLGVTTLIGAILLIGIAVNNAIIMVEFIEQLRKDYGFSRHEAILTGCATRLRPILMTSGTTIAGLIPVAAGFGEGSEMVKPLGVAVIFGLGLATFLTLFIIPCVYCIMEDGANLLRAAFGFAPRLKEGHAEEANGEAIKEKARLAT